MAYTVKGPALSREQLRILLKLHLVIQLSGQCCDILSTASVQALLTEIDKIGLI